MQNIRLVNRIFAECSKNRQFVFGLTFVGVEGEVGAHSVAALNSTKFEKGHMESSVLVKCPLVSKSQKMFLLLVFLAVVV